METTLYLVRKLCEFGRHMLIERYLCSNEKDLQSDTAELLISVWDSDKYNTDTFLGQISMPILNIKAGEVCKQWCTLMTKEGQETKGKLLIEFNLITSDGVRI